MHILALIPYLLSVRTTITIKIDITLPDQIFIKFASEIDLEISRSNYELHMSLEFTKSQYFHIIEISDPIIKKIKRSESFGCFDILFIIFDLRFASIICYSPSRLEVSVIGNKYDHIPFWNSDGVYSERNICLVMFWISLYVLISRICNEIPTILGDGKTNSV